MESSYVWMDGEMVPYHQATVHFITPTLHYGVGVFEGIRCYETKLGPAVFRLRDHMQRFIESIHILGVLDFNYTLEDLCQAVRATIQVNNFTECYIRPLMYLKGPMGMNMDRSQPAVGIAAWPWGPYLGADAMAAGIHMMVASFTRLHPNITMTKAKISGNYVNSLMVKTLALRSGYDEAVIIDPQGYVAECTGENLFMVKRGTLFTPPLANVLDGITRDSVLELAKLAGIPVAEKMLTRDMLYAADEVFITGTAAEIVGARMIDFRKIGDGKVGPITLELTRAYSDAVHGKLNSFTEWLYYVN